MIRPPASQMGPISSDERAQLLKQSILAGVYDQELDRDSAYEILRRQAEQALSDETARTRTQQQASRERVPSRSTRKTGLESMAGSLGRSAMRSLGSQLGRAIVRGLLGSFKGR